ncbi:MAG: hypothetical protein IKI50_02020 [Clostridia bacterium]|nr:hypothetical protein [Clostridia bacterium]
MNKQKIEITNNKTITTNDVITFHITYASPLTVKELSQLFNRINKGINTLNRENGVKNNMTLGKEYAPEILRIAQGSIVMDIILKLVQPVLLNVLSQSIYDQFKKSKTKQEKNDECPIIMIVNGNNNIINIQYLQ